MSCLFQVVLSNERQSSESRLCVVLWQLLLQLAAQEGFEHDNDASLHRVAVVVGGVDVFVELQRPHWLSMAHSAVMLEEVSLSVVERIEAMLIDRRVVQPVAVQACCGIRPLIIVDKQCFEVEL